MAATGNALLPGSEPFFSGDGAYGSRDTVHSVGEADYTKGNRFTSLNDLAQMPGLRTFGNAVLSFAAKASTGYWNIFDPTNGFTAIHTAVLAQIPLDRVAERYFFESDMLFRLSIARARVLDMPMSAVYGMEKSNMKIARIILPFAAGHLRNLLKRIFYNYFLRDFHVASLERDHQHRRPYHDLPQWR